MVKKTKEVQPDAIAANPKPKRPYVKVTDAKRRELLDKIDGGVNLHRAAKQCGIKFQNARLILRVYKQEGRQKCTPLNLRRFVGEYKKHPEKFTSRFFNEPEKLLEITNAVSPHAQSRNNIYTHNTESASNLNSQENAPYHETCPAGSANY